MNISGDKERVGFIGLGAMGLPMAKNLLRAGYDLTVMSRSPGPVEEAVEFGARSVSAAKAVAEQSDVVITMLPASADVEAVVLGVDGLLRGARPESLYVDMSSIDPATTRRIAECCQSAGIYYLDAPVSGGVRGAQEGELAIMVGGEEGALDRARPLFEVLGRKIVHVGPVGAGQVAKIANQIIVAGSIALVSEALVMSRAAGVDPARIIDALEGGFADSAILRNHGRRMLTAEFEPGFRLQLQLKDLELAVGLARSAKLDLDVTPRVRDLVARAVAEGLGDLDHAALYEVVARAQGAPGESERNSLTRLRG